MLTLLILSALGSLLAGYLLMRLAETSMWKRLSARHPVLLPLLCGIAFTIVLATLSVANAAEGALLLSIGYVVGGSIYILGVLVPVSIILRRLGYSGWWAALGFIPIVQIVGLWVLAIKHWPKQAQLSLRGADASAA